MVNARPLYVDSAKGVVMKNGEKNIEKRFFGVSCAAMCDASPLVKAFGPGLTAIRSETKMVGRVYPISCSNDYLTVIKAVNDAKAGDVLVIDGCGQTRAVFGELLAAESKRKGLSGAVVDGAVRDIGGMRDLDFPVFYRTTNPRAGRAEIIEAPTNIVSVFGVSAMAGDWIIGDADGVIVVPGSQIEEILLVAEEIHKAEERVFDDINKGESLSEIIQFEKFRREHEREIRSNLEYFLANKK